MATRVQLPPLIFAEFPRVWFIQDQPPPSATCGGSFPTLFIKIDRGGVSANFSAIHFQSSM